jgi:hypothetical protein
LDAAENEELYMQNIRDIVISTKDIVNKVDEDISAGFAEIFNQHRREHLQTFICRSVPNEH